MLQFLNHTGQNTLLIFCWGFFLYLCSLEILVCSFFSNYVFVWFWYYNNVDLIKWVWKDSFCFHILKKKKIFFKCLIKHQWTHLGLLLSVLKVIHYDSISLLDKSYFFCMSLANCVFHKIGPCYLDPLFVLFQIYTSSLVEKSQTPFLFTLMLELNIQA